VYKLSSLFRSVGQRVETLTTCVHKITPAPGNEQGDIEIKDYVILPCGEDNRLPPRTRMMDVTMTHDRYGRTTQCTNGALTHRVSSTGAPQSDGDLKLVIWSEYHLRSVCVDCELLEGITVGEELALKVPNAYSKREVTGVLLNYTDCEHAMCKMDRIVKKEMGHDWQGCVDLVDAPRPRPPT
jgi:hypothetical protein